MNDRELLEYIAAQVAGLTEEMGGLKKEMGGLTEEVGGLTKELGNVKRITLRIEQNHGKQLTALFDRYKQNAGKLDRIEEEVSKHEEIILRRIK